jgi:hypothetical protein
MFEIGLGVGILIGTAMGVFFTALCMAARREDKDENNKSEE